MTSAQPARRRLALAGLNLAVVDDPHRHGEQGFREAPLVQRGAMSTRSQATRLANVTWQAHMAELIEIPRDYSAGGANRGLPVVWRL
jgi:hypothetical protein